MADRRMFSKTIIDSDEFLNMPLSTQCLYFHLAMRADDEGFLNNPKKIQRMISATEDDFRVLVGKRYVIPFESGIVVIRHWKIHNYIRSDRFKNTIYQDEAEQLTTDRSGAYVLADVDGGTKKDTPPQLDNAVTTTCLPSDYQVATTCLPNGDTGKDSIGEYSLSKDKLNARARASTDQIAKEFSGTMSGQCPTEIEIERELERETKKELEREKKNRKPAASNIDQILSGFTLSEPLKEAIKDFAEFRKAAKAPLTDKAVKILVNRLREMASTDAERIRILENSTMNGYKGIFEPKKTEKKNFVGSFGAYDQRDFDYTDVEKKIRGYDNE